MIIKGIITCFVIGSFFLISACNSLVSYKLRIGNLGKYGVIIIDAPIEFYKDNYKIEPGLSVGDSVMRDAFINYPYIYQKKSK